VKTSRLLSVPGALSKAQDLVFVGNVALGPLVLIL
jgi:hypothetical protein